MLHRQTVRTFGAYGTNRDYMTYKTIIWTYPSYELTFDTSFAKVGRLAAENNCVRQTKRQITINKESNNIVFVDV